MIRFKYVRWKNFLSTGNAWTEVQLDRSPNTLIVGENGAGKSTILDALCFGLFNKPFRKINKPQLMNTINEKDLMVEVEFSVGSRTYTVRRGVKPNVFEILVNGSLMDQPGASRDYQEQLEKHILKLNFKSFTQIVILGSSSFVPFMQLTAASRREVIEDLLDIQIFSSMNLILKDRISTNKNDISESNHELQRCRDKIKLYKDYMSKVQLKNQEMIEEYEEEQIQITQRSKAATVELNTLETNVTELRTLLEDEHKVEKKSSKIVNLIDKLETKTRNANKRIKFFEDNDNCPTCEQVIDSTIKTSKINRTNEIIEETQTAIESLEEQRANILKEIATLDEYNKKLNESQTQIRLLQSEISNYSKNIRLLQQKINKIQEQDEFKVTNEELQEVKSSYIETEKLLEELHSESEILSLASSMLRDGGIKSRIIKQYIPIMNKLINKYLAALDFFVAFHLDEEFNEVIKSRFRDEFSYASFSEGEKMRIDLALLFTWRAVAKLKNSTNTNLLILDEVFDASLDTNGCDEFLKLIHQLGGETNVFVISHKGDILQDKFRNQIRFEKVKNFSRIAA